MSRLQALLPGLLLSGAIGAVAIFLHRVESQVLPHPPLESLVLALLLGVVFRQLFGLPARCQPGQSYAAKQLLEAAVLLLGATMDLRQLFSGGPRLLLAVGVLVSVSLAGGAFIGRRLFRLERKPAILIAVGNAICGNSAIATIAPLIAASTTEVAGAIAFTAIIGVGLVLLLPLLIGVLHLSHGQYGVLVGMSVYAVPQVLAASYPVSEAAGQTATLVKLTRVLFLAPVALYFSLHERLGAPSKAGRGLPRLQQLFPWFILGFIALSILRSLGVIAPSLATIIKEVSRVGTVLAMAALGLAVDLSALRAAGRRTAGAVIASLLLLLSLSYALILGLGLG